MNKVINEIETKIVIEKSKFIGLIFNCESVSAQTQILKKVKSKHASATHVCYASVIYDNGQLLNYSSDDREPSGTAGIQILQALKEQEFVNTLCIVVRYFGGIKLGVAGLGRAYKETALSSMQNNKREVTLKSKIKVSCTYNNFNKIKPYLVANNMELIEPEYNNDITFYTYANNEQQNYLLELARIENLNETNYN